jgi:indolepyruvate ferredoxin oxidoreductase beta subunit
MEGGRAIQRGLVTPDRTTLLASTHRVFSIAEKSALGDGRVDSDALLAHAAAAAKRFVRFDMAGGGRGERQRHRRGALRRARRHRRAAVQPGSVRGDDRPQRRRRRQQPEGVRAACAQVQGGAVDAPAPAAVPLHGDIVAQPCGGRARRRDRGAAGISSTAPPRGAAAASLGVASVPAGALDPRSGRCSARIEGEFPAQLRRCCAKGVRRLIDYQDPAYAELFSIAWRRSRPLPRWATAFCSTRPRATSRSGCPTRTRSGWRR